VPDDASDKEYEANQANQLLHDEKKLDSEHADCEHRCLPILSRKYSNFTELLRWSSRSRFGRRRFRNSSQVIVSCNDLCGPAGFLQNN
jgi:hypothetical protein